MRAFLLATSAGAVTVPSHAPLAARQIHFQLQNAEVSWLFVSTSDQLEKIRQVRAEIKVLGDGELKNSLTVQAHKFSKSAEEKITRAGGKAEVLS